jgi:glycosyltransferase involved in cell wall biosynthesis
VRNLDNSYLNCFYDFPHQEGDVWQPEVYALAENILSRGGYNFVIDIGFGSGQRLSEISFSGEKIGVDFGADLDNAQQYPQIRWIRHDLNEPLKLPDLNYGKALVICSGVIEHLREPLVLLRSLKDLFDSGTIQTLVISTPDRDRARGLNDLGPPQNPARVAEWTQSELSQLLQKEGIPVVAHGFTRSFSKSLDRGTQVAIADLALMGLLEKPKRRVTALAIVPVFNERDVVRSTVMHLLGQGFQVHVIDNWSSDGSFEIIKNLARKEESLTFEVFPQNEPSEGSWKSLLERIEQIAHESTSDWVVRVDADEELQSFKSGLPVLDALSLVDSLGFDKVNFTVLHFRPVQTGILGRRDWRNYFEFAKGDVYGKIQRAWKNSGVYPEVQSSGGHVVSSHTQLFPFNFIIRHYPLRSRAQARKKVFIDRGKRLAGERTALGWHTHYDGIDRRDRFIWRKHDLLRYFDDIQTEYLPESLAFCGVEHL